MSCYTIKTRQIDQPALVSFLCAQTKNKINELQCTLGQLVDALQGDYIEGNAQLSAATKKCSILHCATLVRINGELRSLAGACTSGITGCAVPVCKYGAWRVETNGAATCVIPACNNVCGFATAAAALACLPALTANYASLGTVTLINGTCNFTPNTTKLNCASICITFTDGTTTANAVTDIACAAASMTVDYPND